MCQSPHHQLDHSFWFASWYLFLFGQRGPIHFSANHGGTTGHQPAPNHCISPTVHWQISHRSGGSLGFLPPPPPPKKKNSPHTTQQIHSIFFNAVCCCFYWNAKNLVKINLDPHRDSHEMCKFFILLLISDPSLCHFIWGNDFSMVTAPTGSANEIWARI